MTTLQQNNFSEVLTNRLGEKLVNFHVQHGELTIVVDAREISAVSKILRDDAALLFDTLIDLCGMDYLTYDDDLSEESGRNAKRFAVVYHLLSVEKNCRLRMRVFADNNEFPAVDSVTEIWPVANWFEREAFDLYGIVFSNHPDLRRILTDYGFIGNPFRKDFPLTGYVEMRYDEQQKRVIYQPVSIEPREITPLVRREEYYGDCEL
ncbi:NADH-quinone oxidoreductase subunit C [Nitrosomonas sp.]|uniref:NADH-quinone oxidoreductase subunit C n=1 Tax=Nitrosomonas sp. TaxID=42353 RepID=UPI001DE8BCCC|nr:NADH-quinone oxidoreductase subunit C [Nitrosomonas sp.]MBX3618111.1 NADH-quinone oxidoreductase subunit C [Nitrosomonas sp.]